ncbi:MAG: type II toxin-antitoxin system RelB/DinJ family antitoxin [Eubacterium sp.]
MSTEREMTNFTFKMDRTTREAYSQLCDSLGLTMSSATLALVKQAVRNQGMSFSLRDENGFTPEEAAELKRRIREVRRGAVSYHKLMED